MTTNPNSVAQDEPNTGLGDYLIPVKFKPERCSHYDHSKLRIGDGVIHFSLFQQDGSLQPMTMPDNYQNRCYVSWFQIHDRYTPRPK